MHNVVSDFKYIHSMLHSAVHISNNFVTNTLAISYLQPQTLPLYLPLNILGRYTRPLP